MYKSLLDINKHIDILEFKCSEVLPKVINPTPGLLSLCGFIRISEYEDNDIMNVKDDSLLRETTNNL